MFLTLVLLGLWTAPPAWVVASCTLLAFGWAYGVANSYSGDRLRITRHCPDEERTPWRGPTKTWWKNFFMNFMNGLIPPGPPVRQWEDDYPELRLLKENWREIAQEAHAVMRDAPELGEYDQVNMTSKLTMARNGEPRWLAHYLVTAGNPVCDRCPITTALLAKIPNAKFALFSELEPGRNIIEHEGPYRGSLRCHLTLRVPDGFAGKITVAGRDLTWKEGELLLFDDTYTHSVSGNDNMHQKGGRIVLLLDLERKTPAVPSLIRFVGSRIINAYARQLNAVIEARSAVRAGY
jgi:aspartyl/asparaginyl beta-hydroxylase (cupin superfamily)